MSQNGESALTIAIQEDRPALVDRLIAGGADVNAASKVRCLTLGAEWYHVKLDPRSLFCHVLLAFHICGQVALCSTVGSLFCATRTVSQP